MGDRFVSGATRAQRQALRGAPGRPLGGDGQVADAYRDGVRRRALKGALMRGSADAPNACGSRHVMYPVDASPEGAERLGAQRLPDAVDGDDAARRPQRGASAEDLRQPGESQRGERD